MKSWKAMPLRRHIWEQKLKNGFKTPSKAQWLRYPAHCNAHVLRVRSASNAHDALPLSLI